MQTKECIKTEVQEFSSLSDIVKLAEELFSHTFSIKDCRGNVHHMVMKELGYIFKFDRAKKRFGLCHYGKKIISLSKPICLNNLNKFEDIRNTLLHEMAHAFCVRIYGRQAGRGHCHKWRSIARQLGDSGERCFNSEKINLPQTKYTGKCPSCGRERPFARKPKRSYACGKCCNGVYQYEYKMEIIQNY